MHPILFTIPGLHLPVRAYGTFLVAGFLVGLWRTMKLARRRMATEPADSPRRIDPDNIFDVGIMGLLIGLVGARLAFVLLNWANFEKHPIDALKIWSGGLTLQGGLLFGILYMAWFCRRKKISMLAVGDLSAPGWAIGYTIGRFGCLFNGCCYGGVCDLPWGLRFPDEQHPGMLTPPSHPTQIYASLFNLAFFFILLRWEKRPRRDGELFFGYLAMYGFYRFIVESFRVGATASLIPGTTLTLTHIVSALMILLGVTAIVILRKRRPAYSDAAQIPTTPAPAAV
jgi:phosphatidylglycerol:prolipoprotein diacylglycerol transferase